VTVARVREIAKTAIRRLRKFSRSVSTRHIRRNGTLLLSLEAFSEIFIVDNLRETCPEN
jgi:hypothetical protein